MSYAYPENCSSVYILFISTWHKFDYNFCLQICDCNNEQHCLNRFNVLFRHCLYSTKSASFVPRISHRIVDDFLWFKLFSTVFIGDKPFYLSRLFIVGNSSTSLIAGLFVIIMTMRSMPKPIPPVGGIPMLSAFRKSSSVWLASSSPAANASS